MSDRKLKTVTRTQGNNQALKDGSVRPRTFEFDFVEVPVLIDGFRRMVRGLEFDISEMALSTYLCAREHGKRMTALPVIHVTAREISRRDRSALPLRRHSVQPAARETAPAALPARRSRGLSAKADSRPERTRTGAR